MNFWEFMNKYNGKYIDFDRAYGNQCVDLFRQFNKEVLELDTQPKGVKGAKDFWNNYETDKILQENFTKIPNTPDFIPWTGDIAVFCTGNYGHVAICTGQNSTTKVFESFDQNWPTNSVCKKVSHNYKSFYGVLRPKAQNKVTGNTETTTSSELKTLARNTNLREEPNTNSKAVLYLANTTLYVLEKNVANCNGYTWDKVKIRVNGKEGYMINQNYK